MHNRKSMPLSNCEWLVSEGFALGSYTVTIWEETQSVLFAFKAERPIHSAAVPQYEKWARSGNRWVKYNVLRILKDFKVNSSLDGQPVFWMQYLCESWFCDGCCQRILSLGSLCKCYNNTNEKWTEIVESASTWTSTIIANKPREFGLLLYDTNNY